MAIKDFISELKNNEERFSTIHDFERGFAKVVGKMDLTDFNEINEIYAKYTTSSQLRKLKSKFYKDNELDVNAGDPVESKTNFVKLVNLIQYDIFLDGVLKNKGIFSIKYRDVEEHLLWQIFKKEMYYFGFKDPKILEQLIDEVVSERVDSAFYLRRKHYVSNGDGAQQLEMFVDALTVDSKIDRPSLLKTMKILFLSIIAAADGATRSPLAIKFTCYEILIVLVGLGRLHKSKLFKIIFAMINESSHFKGEAKPSVKDEKNIHEHVCSVLTEISEIEYMTLNLKLTEYIKGFFSKTEDIVFRTGPYKGVSFPRRTVFFGTTNKEIFLPDGNMRQFVPIDVLNIDEDKLLKINFESLFKYIVDEYEAGSKWWPTDEEDSELIKLHEHLILHHQVDGKYKIMANDVSDQITANDVVGDKLVNIGAKKIYISLTCELPNETEVRRLAEAMKAKNNIEYNSKGSLFTVPKSVEDLYVENSKYLGL